MIEIEIQGLNARQQVLADIIWACDSRDNVDAFIKGLPTVALKREAKSIVDMMVMAVVEQAYNGLGSLDEAESVLRKYNKGKA
jgi:hypothetical protein